MNSYSNNNNSGKNNEFRRRYAKPDKAISERDFRQRYSVPVKVENGRDNLPDVYEAKTSEQRLSEMRNNPSMLDNCLIRFKENCITHQQKMVVKSRTKYNESVNAARQSCLEKLKLEKEIQNGQKELDLREKRGRIRELELERDKAKLIKEIEDLTKTPVQKELEKYHEELEITKRKSGISLKFELFNYEEHVKKKFYRDNTLKQTLEDIKMAEYAKVLKDTPLSKATEEQLEMIRQIDEDLESHRWRMSDEENY
jgi:hypothetical protein